MKRITLTMLCLLFTVRLFASHVSSADIRYEYTGYGDVYRVYLTTISPCVNGGALPPQFTTVEFSGSCGTFSRSLPVLSTDTLSLYPCNQLGSCSMPNSSFPQYTRNILMDTVTLVPCVDWSISWTICCRDVTISNLQYPGSEELYIKAFLNNSTVHNSSPYVANAPHHYVGTTGMNALSVQAVDAEQDSIAYEIYQPQSANGIPIPLIMGYTLTSPFGPGSLAQINSATKMLELTTPMSGRFNLALRVSDYRAGQLVGYSSRDIQVTTLSGVASPAPSPSSLGQFQVVTCPGQMHSVTINYTDAQNDSVELIVSAPSLPGFSFTTTTLSGPGTGSATIDWTTPASADPATLPFFFINVRATDNSCDAGSYTEQTIAVLLRQCTTDSVWAGDANGDWTVNVYDPLAVAVAYGSTGAPRTGATTNWQAEWCAPWADTFVNGVNYHHADCNGDGTVDALDLGAISSNWGSFHLKEGSRSKTTSVPDLWFDISNIGFHPGATVAVPVKLGTTAFPMNGFYGLATEVTVSGVALTNPVDITHGNTWVGPSASTLQFKRVNPSDNGQVSLAYARTDQQPVSGEGVIGYLEFDIPVTAVVGQQLHLSFSNTRIIDEHMNELTSFNVIDTSVLITPLSVNTITGRQVHAAVVPNPSNGQAHLEIFLQQAQRLEMTIVNHHGQLIHRSTVQAASGHNTFALPEDVVPGIYLLNLSDNDQFRQSLKWIRQ